jgi:5-methylcytosine-specific restriction endonuclease McrA
MNTIICQQCNIKFRDYLSNKRRFCSLECYWKSLIGKSGGMLGKHHSEKTKEKISRKCLGRRWRLSEETKERIRKANKGKKPYIMTDEIRRKISISNGGTGISDRTNKRYYHLNDIKYKSWRSEVFLRDNWTCQMCGKRSKKKESVYIEPHHIKGWAKYPKLRYELSNGISLCRECHKLTHK